MGRSRLIISIVLLLSMLMYFGGSAGAQPEENNISFETEREDGYFTMINEEGELLQQTALPIFPGDEYIAGDNRRYKVIRVDGDQAIAQFIGMENMEISPEEEQASTSFDEDIVSTQGKPAGKIAIYHTHSDESYVPTEGTHSIAGKGGILEVGRTFAEALKRKGLDVIQSSRSHEPHDQNAYYRSRRTATELLKDKPLALIDVHRDAVPPNVYRANIKGQDVTKIKLVVGRQNPRMDSNLEFAKQIKAKVDKSHPGLIEGIMLAKGDFNQDLSPRAILLEVGAHTNKREEAERAVKMLADDIPTIVGVTTPSGGVPPSTPQEDSRAWRTVAMIVGAVMAASALFLLISTGSLSGSWDKLKQFTSREFANALYNRLGRRKGNQEKAGKKPSPKDNGNSD